MASKTPLVYWDACVFIAGYQKEKDRVARVTALERDARDNRIRVLCSHLIRAEVIKCGEEHASDEEHARIIARHMSNKYFSFVPVDRRTAVEAADLTRKHGIKPNDAVHLATAIITGCQVFYTYDGDGEEEGLLDFDGKLGNELPIKRPGEWGQMPLIPEGEA